MHQLTVTFSVDPAHAFDTLEAVLAIARRGGLQLGALDYCRHARVDLLAPDPRLLDLFLARLCNQIGVDAIVPSRPQHGLATGPLHATPHAPAWEAASPPIR